MPCRHQGREEIYSSNSFLTPALDGVSGQHQPPPPHRRRALHPVPTLQEAGGASELVWTKIIIIIIIIRGATALTSLGRLSSRRWQSFPTAPDGTGLTCGQHIESHSCIFSFQNRTVTSLFK
jgi:hypothetical protein